MASTRRWMPEDRSSPSLAKIWAVWVSTVHSETLRRVAIAAFGSPFATSRNTSCSRGVSRFSPLTLVRIAGNHADVDRAGDRIEAADVGIGDWDPRDRRTVGVARGVAGCCVEDQHCTGIRGPVQDPRPRACRWVRRESVSRHRRRQPLFPAPGTGPRFGRQGNAGWHGVRMGAGTERQ